MAHDMGVTWNEYWDFLDCFTDLSTTDGLHKLEAYLRPLHESESLLLSQDEDLERMEEQMGRLNLGFSPDGKPLRGSPDPGRVLRCWGTPPGMGCVGGGADVDAHLIEKTTFHVTSQVGVSENVESESRLVDNDVKGIKQESISLTEGDVDSESASESADVDSEITDVDSESADVDSEITDVDSENADVDSESTDGGVENESELPIGSGTHMSETTASADYSGCDSSETTLLVDDGEVENESTAFVDCGRDNESETRCSDEGSKDVGTVASSETGSGVHGKDVCQTKEEGSHDEDRNACGSSDSELPNVTTCIVGGATADATTANSSSAETCTACQTHQVPSCEVCQRLSPDVLLIQTDDHISEQNATVLIVKDEENKAFLLDDRNQPNTGVTSCTVHETNDTADCGQHTPHSVGELHDVSKHLKDGAACLGNAPDCDGNAPNCDICHGGSTRVHHHSSSCTRTCLNETADSKSVPRFRHDITQLYDRGDGPNSGISCKPDDVKVVNAGDTNTLPCSKKTDCTTNDKASVSDDAVWADDEIARVSSSASCDKRHEMSSYLSDTNQFYKKMTKSKDSVADDACSLCSSVSSYHTARDFVDFDYASIDDVFLQTRSQSPRRVPPVFILG